MTETQSETLPPLFPKMEAPMQRTHGDDVVLGVDGVCKTYGPVSALRPLSLHLRSGEVHALVGENGSGKSTLVGILSGAVRPDRGVVTIGATRLQHFVPWESQRNGVMTVFQDGTIVQELSVGQNLYLGVARSQRPSYRRVNVWATERLAEFGLSRLNPRDSVRSLAPGDAQLLDIVRAVMSNPRVLLLDEATSALDSSGVDVALELVRRAAQAGVAVLFVSHRLSEVFRVADRISVLRDGEYQGTDSVSAISPAEVVEKMAGASVTLAFPARANDSEIGEALLVAEGLRGEAFGPIDLIVRRGELLGVAGADGNGQLGLLRGLSGQDLIAGVLSVAGKCVSSFDGARRQGVAFLSSDRRAESLFPSLSIQENIVSGTLRKLSRLGYVSYSREREEVKENVQKFGIRLGSPRDPVLSLSGGNQQKVALSRALATQPEVLLIDEPTKGVDVRSRMDIYRVLRAAAGDGRAVVVVSSDAAELAGLCDRIVVLSRGEMVAELRGEDTSEERIVAAFARADGSVANGPIVAGRGSRATSAHQGSRRRLGSDALRLGLVVLVLVALGGYAQSQDGTFLSSGSIYDVLLVTLPLAVVAAAEFVVMFVGGIDVAVGATMGLTVAVGSFVFTSEGSVFGLIALLVTAVGVGIVIGTVNAVVVERLRVPAVIATIGTMGILQGVGLIMRPTPGGEFNSAVGSVLTASWGPVPSVLVVVALIFVVLDGGLRFSGRGLRLRAVGLDAQAAFRLGENTSVQRQLSYVGCAILAAVAGLLLAAQVGSGTPTVGNQFLLLAVAAPILGGASLLGGRGSFVGCLVGAMLLELSEALPGALHLSNGVSYVFAGLVTLLAILVYSGSAWGLCYQAVRVASFRRRIRKVRVRNV